MEKRSFEAPDGLTLGYRALGSETAPRTLGKAMDGNATAPP